MRRLFRVQGATKLKLRCRGTNPKTGGPCLEELLRYEAGQWSVQHDNFKALWRGALASLSLTCRCGERRIFTTADLAFQFAEPILAERLAADADPAKAAAA